MRLSLHWLRPGLFSGYRYPARPDNIRSMALSAPVVVVADDPWTRLIDVRLDPSTSAERRAAFAAFMAHDEPQFAGWCEELRARAGGLYPGDVRLVRSPVELRANLPAARALVVESFAVGTEELACAPQLAVVHKFGAVTRSIDVAACVAAGIKVLGVRRQDNLAWEETGFGMMIVRSTG